MIGAEAFWNKTARKYAASPVKDMAAYEDTLARTRAHLAATDRVLEVGCGTGSTALLLADSVAHITGTDISSEMIAIANEKLQAGAPGNVTFLRTTLEDEMPEDVPFDAALAFSFLHLHEDLPAAIRAIHERLKPGGVFISKTVVLGEGSLLWRLVIPPMRLLGMAPPVRFLTTRTLEETIRAGGFEMIERHTYTGSFAPHFIVARKV